MAESLGEHLIIPQELYATAANEQEERLIKDPWEDLLASVTGDIVQIDATTAEERISTRDLLQKYLCVSPDKMTDFIAKRVKHLMERLGWHAKKIKFEVKGLDPQGKAPRRTAALQGYWRPRG